MAGTAGAKPLIIDAEFLGAGQVRVSVDHGTSTHEVIGTYTMSGGVANVSFAVPGDEGGSYAAQIDSDGANGRIALASGKSVKLKLRR